MIEKMEEFELAGDEDLPDLREDFDDGGLATCRMISSSRR